MIMLSATLTIENDFSNFIHRNGLAEFVQNEKMVTFIEDSPFDYEQQAALFIVNDMPAPGTPSFLKEVVSVLKDVFTEQGGRTMVLFTSRQQLHEAAKQLRPICAEIGLSLLVQNEDGEFTSLIKEFTCRDNCILMGVETFWEGIDLKGEVLKCLVIVRLPFRSPADPYCSAWDKYLAGKHHNSFKHFMLPDAVIRFKQGVGRLIRSEEDRGVVVVLDNRIESTRYGKAFLNSIPIKNQLSVSKADVAENLKTWSAGTEVR
jgi:ATP-dependent DNA helicase DinG